MFGRLQERLIPISRRHQSGRLVSRDVEANDMKSRFTSKHSGLQVI